MKTFLLALIIILLSLPAGAQGCFCDGTSDWEKCDKFCAKWYEMELMKDNKEASEIVIGKSISISTEQPNSVVCMFGKPCPDYEKSLKKKINYILITLAENGTVSLIKDLSSFDECVKVREEVWHLSDGHIASATCFQW